MILSHQLNPGPLEEEPVLLTAEPAPAPNLPSFSFVCFCFLLETEFLTL